MELDGNYHNGATTLSPKRQTQYVGMKQPRNPSSMGKVAIILLLLFIFPIIVAVIILASVTFAIVYTVKSILNWLLLKKRKLPHKTDTSWNDSKFKNASIRNVLYHNGEITRLSDYNTAAPSHPQSENAIKKQQKASILFKSCYITMKDGTRIALDIYIPNGVERNSSNGNSILQTASGKKLPCILHQTRYHRSLVLRWPLNLFVNSGEPFNVLCNPYFSSFLDAGYAVVSMDIRGTGASSGTQSIVWSTEERLDSTEVIDWIASQPWSDKTIGLWGISYDGTAAFNTMATSKHPSIKACIPMYMFWDMYHDIVAPGGIQHHFFITGWQKLIAAMDTDDLSLKFPLLVKFLVAGVTPAHDDMALLHDAVAQHSRNWSATEEMDNVVYRDTKSKDTNDTLDSISAFSKEKEAREAEIPTLFYSGWYDCTARGAIQAYVSTSASSTVVIGPWNHAGSHFTSTESYSRETDFNHKSTCTDFFKTYLPVISNTADNFHIVIEEDTNNQCAIEEDSASRVLELGSFHFYCAGEETWNHASEWPVKGSDVVSLFLSQNEALTFDSDKVEASEDVMVASSTSGARGFTRWQAMDKPLPITYRNWHKCKHLVFTTNELSQELKICGSPVVELRIKSTGEDADVIVYVAAILPNSKKPVYVTEGHFRASHRKEVEASGDNTGLSELLDDGSINSLPTPIHSHIPCHSFRKSDSMPMKPNCFTTIKFDLLPVSFLFPKGSCIQLRISSQDPKHFATDAPPDRQVTIKYEAGCSSLQLPRIPTSFKK